MGKDVFLANRIDNAFAVVETGAPGVQVFYENRPVAVTDGNGRAFLPSLRSYQRNKISIDPSNLPVDAEVETTKQVVAPADRAGVRINFGVHTDAHTAIVVLTDAQGKVLAAGVRGTVNDNAFVVGYDGRAYMKGLTDSNVATVTLPDRECVASFAYEPRPNEQVVIGPVICR